MNTLLRRVRGLLGLGVFTGAVWALIGATIGVVVLLVDPAVISAGETPPWIAFYFARAGFVAGVVAGIALAVAERRQGFSGLRLSRMAAWGAIGGVLVPWLAAGPQAMTPLFVALGAGTSVAALALAKRGERLTAGSSHKDQELNP